MNPGTTQKWYVCYFCHNFYFVFVLDFYLLFSTVLTCWISIAFLYFPITFNACTLLSSVARCTGAKFFSFKIFASTGLEKILNWFKLTRVATYPSTHMFNKKSIASNESFSTAIWSGVFPALSCTLKSDKIQEKTENNDQTWLKKP